jgi:hypothetical protein
MKHLVILTLSVCAAFYLGGYFPRLNEDMCPSGWQDADWNNHPGVKVGYWFCMKA